MEELNNKDNDPSNKLLISIERKNSQGQMNNFLQEGRQSYTDHNMPEVTVEKPEGNKKGEHQEKSVPKSIDIERKETELSSNSYKFVVEKFLDSRGFQIFINVLTVYALFADDFRTAFFPKSADSGIDAVFVVCIASFSLEIVLCLISKENYFLSFFFWLDFISTVSIIFDLQWFQEAAYKELNSP